MSLRRPVAPDGSGGLSQIAAPDTLDPAILPPALSEGGVKTTAFAAAANTHYVVTFAAGIGAQAITLPTAPAQGTEVAFTRTDANDLTSFANITPGGSDTIAEISPWPLTQMNNVAWFIYSGTTWYPNINWETANAADIMTRTLLR